MSKLIPGLVAILVGVGLVYFFGGSDLSAPKFNFRGGGSGEEAAAPAEVKPRVVKVDPWVDRAIKSYDAQKVPAGKWLAEVGSGAGVDSASESAAVSGAGGEASEAGERYAASGDRENQRIGSRRGGVAPSAGPGEGRLAAVELCNRTVSEVERSLAREFKGVLELKKGGRPLEPELSKARERIATDLGMVRNCVDRARSTPLGAKEVGQPEGNRVALALRELEGKVISLEKRVDGILEQLGAAPVSKSSNPVEAFFDKSKDHTF